MVITYQGNESFKISQGDLSLTLNPKAKTSADITLFNIGREDTSEKSGFVISGPGEYEVKGVFIKGFLSKGRGGKLNTIYTVNFEGVNLCFLGALQDEELSGDTLEGLENIDILFTPVTHYKLAVSLEPALIIPAGYTKDTLSKFLKDAGEDPESVDKLVVKKKDLEGKEGDIIVLKEE